MEGSLCPRSAAYTIPFTLQQFCEAGMVSPIPHVGSGGNRVDIEPPGLQLMRGNGKIRILTCHSVHPHFQLSRAVSSLCLECHITWPGSVPQA